MPGQGKAGSKSPMKNEPLVSTPLGRAFCNRGRISLRVGLSAGLPGPAPVPPEEVIMVRKIAGSLPLVVLLALSQPLAAQTDPPHEWTPDRADAEAPASITQDRVLPKGAFQLGVRFLYSGMSGQGYGTDSLTVDQVLTLFDVANSEMVTQGLAVDVLMGVTDRVTVTATGVFAQKAMDHLSGLEGQPNAFLFYETEASGLQDLSVHALYDVLSSGDLRFHLHGGVSIPVGSIDSGDVTPFSNPDETQLPYMQQLGSGTIDLTPGFTFNIQNHRASLGVQGKATIRMGENDRGWALGDLYLANMWAGIKASEWASASLGLQYSNWGNVEGFDEDLNANESPAHNTLTQAGWRVDLPIGVNFVMPEGQFEGHRLSVDFLFPIHQDLDGPQLRHNWSVVAGWSVDIGF